MQAFIFGYMAFQILVVVASLIFFFVLFYRVSKSLQRIADKVEQISDKIAQCDFKQCDTKQCDAKPGELNETESN
jgi:hypothetical protein